eukprot:COSAG05_NODE_7058_length_861_cov_1.816273_3_plen_54_part_01
MNPVAKAVLIVALRLPGDGASLAELRGRCDQRATAVMTFVVFMVSVRLVTPSRK